MVTSFASRTKKVKVSSPEFTFTWNISGSNINILYFRFPESERLLKTGKGTYKHTNTYMSLCPSTSII